MPSSTPNAPNATSQPDHAARGFAVPARFFVIVLFMIQFMLILAAFGGFIPTLHAQGVSTVLLVLGGLGFLVVMQLVLGFLAKLAPVRCAQCPGVSRFLGFGWWPFIYRFQCGECGTAAWLEVGWR